ncbi:MAG: glycine--tRNA ligase subunit beta [Proteobacteria bacterium]|nr:glycine--tRNA ligase subunit beta [Pseudomonadota bacterium]
MNQNLLVELFVEELPPKALKKLGEAFSTVLADSLKAQGLAAADALVTSFASPRRLAVQVANVADKAADKPISQKLMPVAVGLDANGNATPALLKKLAALGADASAVASLKRVGEGKAETLMLDSLQPGVSLAAGLQKALEDALAKLPIPKVMGYQLADGWSTVHFVRPAHKLIALHGADVIDISVLGLKSGRETLGHRFEAAKPVVSIHTADSYAAQLRDEGAVIASFAERRAEIVRQLAAAAAKVGGGVKAIEDEALLDEVTALVERPNVVIGQFETEYLAVPQECLILTMKANQKYFPLLDANGKLTNKFLIVSNIAPADASAVIQGNERVVRPRLADAKFFFDQDRKKTLASRVEGLAKVVYHNKLGTQGERMERVRAIAKAIAAKLGVDVAAADTAAQLAKTDLLTDMVGEFPELQGIMGGYYAKHDGLCDTVADAIEDHYKPRFAGDDLPRNDIGVVVALADKLETLVGLFGIGQVPTGDKDPFALRRHALGVIRMLIEKNLDLDLPELLLTAFKVFPFEISMYPAENIKLVMTFIFERLSGQLREQGYSAQEVDAVLALKPQRLGDIAKRLAAVRAFAALPEAAALAAANKRVGNILKKIEGELPTEVKPALLAEDAEKALFAALGEIAPKATAAFDSGDYTASLQALAALRGPVDAFFDAVMVNAEDPALRANRQALLNQLYGLMNRVADLSKLSA